MRTTLDIDDDVLRAAKERAQRPDHTRLHGPRQLTDANRLALAVSNGGRLVTFDRSLTMGAVVGATTDHLVML